MKKAIIIVIIITVIAVAAYTINKKLKAVSFEVNSFDITRITKNYVYGNLVILINNPFTTVDLSNLDLDIYFESYKVSKLEQKKPKAEIDGDKIFLALDFKVDIKKVSFNKFLELMKPGEKMYTINGTVKISKWGFNYDTPINYSDTFKIK